MNSHELASLLRRIRQALWVVRAASCGADTCPAPDAVTALTMIHTAVNGITSAERELSSADGRSMTPVHTKEPFVDRGGAEILARKTMLELEELQRNVGTMTRDMSLVFESADVRRLQAAGVLLDRALGALNVAIEGALLAIPPSDPTPRR